MQIGYARVSTLDQNLDLQIDALNQAGCKKIFQEKITGTKLKREQLQNAIDYLSAYAGTIRTASRFTSGHSAGVDSDS